MITYVNSVFVSNLSGEGAVVATSLSSVAKGQFIFWDIDANAAISANTIRFKIGMGTGKTISNDKGSMPEIKWSNIIKVDDIKGWSAASYAADTEDVVTIDFTSVDNTLMTNTFAVAGKRIIVRLTFKDLPTRFRKWTESYEYVTANGDNATKIAQNIATMINKEAKRARVIASASAGVLTLTAMKYDDDESVNSINWYNKVRFNANVYYTDPAAEGWESLNKHYPTGLTITKVPGKTYQASAKLVRDREAQSMGYQGILNHGEGTWPIIQPAMVTDLDAHYNVVTIEFENMYRTADDLFRKTKQSVEIYMTGATSVITTELAKLSGDIVDNTIE